MRRPQVCLPAYVLAGAAQAQQDRLCKAAVETDRCLVCLGPPREPTVLPCGHTFCTGCVSGLRSKGVSQACPLCRAPLPPGQKLGEPPITDTAVHARAPERLDERIRCASFGLAHSLRERRCVCRRSR